MINFKEFLSIYHGRLNKILISYPQTDKPCSNKFSNKESYNKVYTKWDEETNKSFIIDTNLKQYTDCKELQPYFKLSVYCWDLFYDKVDGRTLEVHLDEWI